MIELDLLVFLRYVATGSFMDVAADLCITSKSSAWRAIHSIMNLFVKIRKSHIYFPNDYIQLSQKFKSTQNFPGVIGCVDGTHVPIQVPKNEISETFRCRKGFMSLNVQMICGPTSEVFDIDPRWPGSTHDSTVWSQSDVKQLIEQIPNDFHLLGDSAYPLESYMLVPYKSAKNRQESNFLIVIFYFILNKF